MTQPLDPSTPIPFGELPYHELIEVDVTTLGEEQLREYLKVVQEQRTSPQKRRSTNTKAAKKITGKSLDISSFL